LLIFEGDSGALQAEAKSYGLRQCLWGEVVSDAAGYILRECEMWVAGALHASA
jgi:hypothetical protein